MFGLITRRLYSTRRPPSELAARTKSTPLAVRLRREKKLGPPSASGTDANEAGLSPSEQARYMRLKALNQLPIFQGRPVTEEEWVQTLHEKRARIRGLKTVRNNGVPQVEVVGQPVYLPNIIFTLVRNFTPPGEAYNPYEATFYIPLSVTKTDIRSYLKTVYDVDTTYIRTQILHKSSSGSKLVHKRLGIRPTFRKRAVVGLEDPFYYPQRFEDMTEEEKQALYQILEETYDMSGSRAGPSSTRQERQLTRMGYNEQSLSNRRAILDAVKRQRVERQKKEEQIADRTEQWREIRQTGEAIVLQKPSIRKSISQSSDSSA